MARWHLRTCKFPDVIVNFDSQSLSCRNCNGHPQLDPRLASVASLTPLQKIPPDESPSHLGLYWPSTVPYVSSPSNVPSVGSQAVQPNQSRTGERQSRPFKHSPIYERRLKPGEMRLLRLPAADSADELIHAALEIYSQDDCPEYETVSYTWGGEGNDSTLCKPIYIGMHWDVSFQTQNCWAMLQLMRPRVGERLIWVDALCINQHDITEREDQVAKMVFIYEHALRTVVFLGPDAVRPLSTGVHYPPRRRLIDLPLGSPDPRVRDSEDSFRVLFLRLLRRRYFQRVWVIQELVVSREVVLRIGSTEYWINHETRRNIEELLQQRKDTGDWDPWDWDKTVAPWFQHIAQRSLHAESQRQFLKILRQTWSCQCADSRDKIFGILGLAPNGAESIRPNYSISTQHVFIGAFAHCLINLKEVEILLSASGIKGWGHSPSWVPPWRSMNPLRLRTDTIDFEYGGWLLELGWNLLCRTGTYSGQHVRRDYTISVPPRSLAQHVYDLASTINSTPWRDRHQGRLFDASYQYFHRVPLVQERLVYGDSSYFNRVPRAVPRGLHQNREGVGVTYNLTSATVKLNGLCRKRQTVNRRNWFHNARISPSTGALTINLIHLMKITCRPELVSQSQPFNCYCFPSADKRFPLYLVITRLKNLDHLISPGEDHIFILHADFLAFFVLRSTSSPRSFRLIAYCDTVLFPTFVPIMRGEIMTYEQWKYEGDGDRFVQAVLNSQADDSVPTTEPSQKNQDSVSDSVVELDELQASLSDRFQAQDYLSPEADLAWTLCNCFLSEPSLASMNAVMKGIMNEEQGAKPGIWECYSGCFERYRPTMREVPEVGHGKLVELQFSEEEWKARRPFFHHPRRAAQNGPWTAQPFRWWRIPDEPWTSYEKMSPRGDSLEDSNSLVFVAAKMKDLTAALMRCRRLLSMTILARLRMTEDFQDAGCSREPGEPWNKRNGAFPILPEQLRGLPLDGTLYQIDIL